VLSSHRQVWCGVGSDAASLVCARRAGSVDADVQRSRDAARAAVKGRRHSSAMSGGRRPPHELHRQRSDLQIELALQGQRAYERTITHRQPTKAGASATPGRASSGSSRASRAAEPT
jgi:hypothetical protein